MVSDFSNRQNIGIHASGGGAKVENCSVNLTLNFNIKITGRPDPEQESSLVQSIIGAVRQALVGERTAIAFNAQAVLEPGIPRRDVRDIQG